MRVIVFGASGRTGKQLVELALGAKHEVTAFVRSPETFTLKHANLKVIKGDGHDAQSVEQALANQDAALIAVGNVHRKQTTLRQDIVRGVIAGMKKHGGKRIVFLSAAGVGDSLEQMRSASFLFGLAIRWWIKHPYADANAAEALLKQSGLQCVIARPVALTDDGPKRHVTAITDGSTEDLKMTIPRADVARFMLIQVTEDRYVGTPATLSS